MTESIMSDFFIDYRLSVHSGSDVMLTYCRSAYSL